MFVVVPRKTVTAMTLNLPRLVKTKSPLQATVDCRQIQIIRLPPTSINIRTRSQAEYIPNIYELLSDSLFELLVTEFTGSDHTLALQIHLYERLSTIFIFILIYSKYICKIPRVHVG